MQNIKQAESDINVSSRGNSKGIWNESQRGLSGSSPLRPNYSCDSQAGRLDCVSSGQRQTKGDYRGRVHSDQMVLV